MLPSAAAWCPRTSRRRPHRSTHHCPNLGQNPEHFAIVARDLKTLGFAGIDLNMGCPDRHVNAAGGGAAMIRTPELAVECLRAAENASDLPVSVKTRLGYTSPDEFRTWLPVLLAEHPAALTVHLRTRKEMSKVPAHFELIPDILALRDQYSPETKLIINGDIKNLTDIQRLSEDFSPVDGYMIGRGVFENPYCFTTHTPTKSELLELFHLHLDLFDQYSAEITKKSGRTPSFEPLKHYFKIYINTFPGSSELRAHLMECHSTPEIRQILKNC